MRVPRIALAVLGCGVAAYGLAELVLNVPLGDLVWLAVWLAAVVIVHDGVVVPLVAGLRSALSRRGRTLPGAVIGVIEAGFAVAAVLGLYVAAELWAQSRMPANPTILVGPYGLRLVLVWLAIAVVVAGACWWILRSHGGGSAPRQERVE
jgi:hypothetical protein